MRSLIVKLTLAFLLVGLTGSMLVAVITRQRTKSAFNQFILTREQQSLVEGLLQYYQNNGSWEGIAERLNAVINDYNDTTSRLLDNRRVNRYDWQNFILLGPDRKIIYSGSPEQIGKGISKRDFDRAINLQSNGETIGWLLLDSPSIEWLPNSPEGLFLRNVNRATLLSALIATGLALTLGGVLAFTMTRSLREMTEVTQEIAQGKLGRHVKVRSKDELGKLASSFNKMSSDLERATQARRQMTADIAHELRSPLSVISGYAEALSDGKLQGSPEIFSILHQETLHLSHMVDDLRTLSLAESGELQLNRTPVSPQVIVQRLVARHAVAAERKEILLRAEFPEPLPEIVVDPERIAQVLDNLVTNAFRYTPQQGKISVSARQNNGMVDIVVNDTGSGINPEHLPYIFDRFYRQDTSRQQNGESGLGLSIAKSIIEAHGGTISVESSLGTGARFTISLPVNG